MALLLAVLPPLTAQPSERPVLGGSWVLVQEAENGTRDIRPRPGAGQGPTGMRGSFGGDAGLAELLRPKHRLEISETDSLVTVTDDAGWSRFLLTSGALMREELGQGGPADVLSRWKGPQLLTERRLDRGGTYAESFEVDRKSGRLILKVSFRTEGMRRPLELRRVYAVDSLPPPGR